MTLAHFSAPAKINLYLQVLGKRADGYHDLSTSFAFVDVADVLRIEPCNDLVVHCSSTHLEGEKNLVWRVLQELRSNHGVSMGLSVYIDKKLPEQAGLGGGSSDAATALMAANRLWDLDLSRDRLIDFAAPFGADIPCFIFGRASIASGVGERLRPLDKPLPNGHVLLVYPGVGLSTAKVFGQLAASSTGLTPSEPTDTMRARSAGHLLGRNDLEFAASQLCPDMARILELLRRKADKAWMSGSGSACVGLFEHQGSLRGAASHIRQAWPRAWTHAGKLHDKHPFTEEWNDHGA